MRVASYRRAREGLRSKGYREDAAEGDPCNMIVSPRATAGFPQIYILDPDRHVIEINAAHLDWRNTPIATAGNRKTSAQKVKR